MAKVKAPNLVEQIKMIAQNASESSLPTNWMHGTVESVSPLSIKTTNMTMPLSESFLVLSQNVQDHYVDLTVSFQTENDDFMTPDHTHTGNMGSPTDAGNLDTTHKHEIKHKIKVLRHLGLKVGEKVVLLRMKGGRKFYVLDRVNPPICEGEWL